MKYLLSFLLMSLTLNTYAADKCYNPARKAAIKYAIAEDNIKDASEFTSEFSDEISEITEYNGTWHKESHSFYNSSHGIIVEVDYAKGKCFVKNTMMFQNDQDQD